MKTRITLQTKLGKNPEDGFARTFNRTADLPFIPVVGMHLGPVVWIQFKIWHVAYVMDTGVMEVQAKQECAFEADVDHVAEELLRAGWLESK